MTPLDCKKMCIEHNTKIATLEEKADNMERYIKSISSQLSAVSSKLNWFFGVSILGLGGVVGILLQILLERR